MAFIAKESGFDPSVKASDFANTGSVGYMQVPESTLAEVKANYPHVDLSKPQTDGDSR